MMWWGRALVLLPLGCCVQTHRSRLLNWSAPAVIPVRPQTSPPFHRSLQSHASVVTVLLKLHLSSLSASTGWSWGASRPCYSTHWNSSLCISSQLLNTIITTLHVVLTLVDMQNMSILMSFVDLRSAFNTIIPRNVIEKTAVPERLHL